ncbi:hypothetical protein CYPRO_0309 [Cyclonatronum proteinivorum]|uniref:Uncharacterized protein n=1 Tax=Cyclonatronum proteinivorum TaxID=1457365 RepID=A0A345UGJ5_9BACT|nr:hypothetical protein [Cyclonatronum proteinivorum]AXI99596.1 hypothetical protein CYPRO_0309 [Cyclonatronum proteinivorum]
MFIQVGLAGSANIPKKTTEHSADLGSLTSTKPSDVHGVHPKKKKAAIPNQEAAFLPETVFQR